MDTESKNKKTTNGGENSNCSHSTRTPDKSIEERFYNWERRSRTTNRFGTTVNSRSYNMYFQGTHNTSRRHTYGNIHHRRRFSDNIRRCLRQLCMKRKTPAKKRSDKLVSRPSLPEHVFTLARIKNVTTFIFNVTSELHYSHIDLKEMPIYAGSGSYGVVKIFKKTDIAVKKVLECFKTELLMTLIAGECALRAKSTLRINNIIPLLAFSIPSKELVFPAYHMDMDSYYHRLARIDKTVQHWKAIEKTFMDLGKAVVFLDVSCGLTHLDIKCGNIFVNVTEGPNPILVDAVIGDFSLALLNTNSTILKSRFDVNISSDKIQSLKVCRGNIKPVFDLVLGHGQTQPCELMIKALNGVGFERRSTPLTSDEGVSIDMYALGQSLMEVILAAGMNFTHRFGISSNPLHFYYHRLMRADYLLDILAYRCMLYQHLFPMTPLTSKNGIPWERAEKIRLQLHSSRHRAEFDKYLEAYDITHRKLFDSLNIFPYLNNLLELAALYCHANPVARTADLLLWN
ncbi:UL13 [Gallid alphaherpesvirus 2]|nr:UL13 [Gallid alphaherpesvirus 2]